VFDAGKRELQWMERLPSGNPNFHEYTFVDSNKITTRLYQLGAKNKTISEVQMTIKRVQGPIALPNLPVDPKRPEEMKVLDRLVGEWQHELTVTEAGKQKAEKSESVAKSILQGHMVEVFETNETRKTKDYWLTWYDEIAKQYRTWYFAGDGTASDFTGTWDEAKKTMSWKSADNTVEGKWIFKNEDLREMLMTIKDKGGKVLRESTGTSKRIAPEGSPKAGNSIELNAHRFVVAAKERIAQTEKIRYKAGQISRMELLRAQADWLEARLALVSAEGDQEKKKLLAKALVANWRDERELVAERVKVGVDAESVLDVHDGRVAEARTRLAKAKIDLPATVAVEFVIPASGGKAERVFAKARELIAAATEKDTVEIRWMTANPLNEQVKELRTELLETGRRHAGKHEAIVAAKLLSEIAWPLDTRHHAQVTDKQFAAIGFKDPLKAPTEIVGVIETPCQNFDISFVAFSPDGHWAALSACTTLLIVDLGNGKVRHKFDCPGGHHFSAAAFSPDGKTIAVAGLDGQITMRDAASGVESYKLPGLFFSLAFSGDGKKLFAGGGEYKTLSNKLVLSVWDLEQRKLIRVDEPKPDFFPGTVTLSPDRKIVASTDAVGGAMVRWWNTADGKLIWFEKTQRQEKGRSPVVLSPDGKFLAAGAEKPVLKIWDATTGRAKHSLTTDSTVFDLSYSPDGSVLAMQEGFEKISLWDTSSYVKRSTIPVSGVSIAIAPDSRHLLVHQGARVVILRLRGVSQK
jgi:WD40 repeat protein